MDMGGIESAIVYNIVSVTGEINAVSETSKMKKRGKCDYNSWIDQRLKVLIE